MITRVDIRLPLAEAADDAARRREAASVLGVETARIRGVRLVRESLDARHRPIRKQLRLEAGVDEELRPAAKIERFYGSIPSAARRIILVGAGPAGLFAALRCLELGARPVILERGRDVETRRRDLLPLLGGGPLAEDSNYCFGEGGAGAFSDGKLFTRAAKRGPVREIYETFAAHGAPLSILTEAHPHIGSDLLPGVVKAMRESILRAGGEVHFGARVTRLLRSADGTRLRGVATRDGREWEGAAVILATGHSARDVYRLLLDEGISLERKAFAVGVRIEHPQSAIDAAQYHLGRRETRPQGLPAAAYSLATKMDGRGVHSFCMCPGGCIVPAVTASDEVVVNGMSLSGRDSPFANAGLVVSVEPEDTDAFAAECGALSGVAFQKAIERAASLAGGGAWRAPAQRAADFLAGRVSASLPATSYSPGVVPADLRALLPDGVARRLRGGLRLFEHRLRGFAGTDALLVGCETRTSAPVRIPRDPETLMHPCLKGLYPCGEGAGFAGGIVSAALDGRKCAEAAVAAFRQ